MRFHNQSGQALTEYLLVITMLVFLVLAHSQFSLNYVASHIMRYASYMAARAESVWPGAGLQYIEEMVGNAQNSKLSFIASPTGDPAEYIRPDNTVAIPFETFSAIPGVPAIQPISVSPFIRERTPDEVQTQTLGELDNEIALPQN